MPSEKSCGALVFREDGGRRLYLLLNYAAGHWDFPKGHVEAGEAEEETARREIGEETGITGLEFLPGFRHRISYSFRRGGGIVPKQVIFFLARTAEKDVRISREHIGFEWLDCNMARQRATYENAKRLLDRAEAHLTALSSP